jgi:hypothetical protein
MIEKCYKCKEQTCSLHDINNNDLKGKFSLWCCDVRVTKYYKTLWSKRRINEIYNELISQWNHIQKFMQNKTKQRR